MKKINLFILVIIFFGLIYKTIEVNANQCSYLFLEYNQTNPYVNNDVTLREDIRKVGIEILKIEKRLDFYKRFNGSFQKRIVIEQMNQMRKLKNELRRGATENVIEAIQVDVISFEANYFYILELKSEMLKMKESGLLNKSKSKLKLKLEKVENYFANNFYRYLAINKMIYESVNGPDFVIAKNAKLIIDLINQKVKIAADNQQLSYHEIKFEEIDLYSNRSPYVLKKIYKKAALREFMTMIKIISLSGPVMNMIKSVVYKLPVKIPFNRFGFKDIEPRKILSEAIGLGHTQHLRDLYIEKIEAIVDLDQNTSEQYSLLKSLNVTSNERDELLVTFARLPETHDIWMNVKNFAQNKLSPNDIIASDFYNRLLIAEKKALAEGEFQLYDRDSGSKILSKVVPAGVTLYYGVSQYFETHSYQIHTFFESVQTWINSLL